MLFATRYNLNHLCVEFDINFTDGSPLKKVDPFKNLGLWIDSDFYFRPDIDLIRNKTNACLGILYRSNHCFTIQVRKRFAHHLVFALI